MPRKPDPTLKPAIIEKVAHHLRDTKIEDVSVRSLGRVLGTSAYPIVYHFGSRDALIDAVVEHLASAGAAATLDPEADHAALSRYFVTVFGGLDDPERALAARLTFELGSVESLDDRDHEQTSHRRQVTVVAAWCAAHGAGQLTAQHIAREAVLAARGAQWGAIVDPDHSRLDEELDAVAAGLAASVHATAGTTA